MRNIIVIIYVNQTENIIVKCRRERNLINKIVLEINVFSSIENINIKQKNKRVTVIEHSGSDCGLVDFSLHSQIISNVKVMGVDPT